MDINIIAAVDLDGGIGKNGTMPWPLLKTDMKRFKELTTGHPIIMGRVTAESIGKALPNRTNIVLSATRKLVPGFDLVTDDIQDALNIARKADAGKCWIIGGAEIYSQTVSLADHIHLTVIHDRYDCDRFFPKVNIHEFYEHEPVDPYVVTEDAVPYTYKMFMRSLY